jgi:hypothetical protein
MSWLMWLMIAACLAVVAATTGLAPKHTRPAADTHLMTVARVVLLLMVAILVWWAITRT